MPTVFFLPKFFEIQTVNKTVRRAVRFNCSGMETLHDGLATTLDNATSNEEDATTSIPGIPYRVTYSESVCNRILHLVANYTNDQPPLAGYNGSGVEHGPNMTSSAQSEPSHQISMGNPNSMLRMHYDINTNIATIIKKRTVSILDQTDMRKNHLYFKIYNVGLITLFTQIIPFGILMYLNIKICWAFQTNGNNLDSLIQSQRKSHLKKQKYGKITR